MRSLLIIIFILIYLIGTLPVLLVLHFVHKKNAKKAERIAHACLCFVLKGIAFLSGIKLDVTGLENVPDVPVLYISNHRSFFDVVLTYPLCKLPTSYVAKADIKNIPLFGVWAKMINALLFDRDNMKDSLKMILNGISLLKADTSVYIFPEGTRNKNKSQTPLLDFHDGSFKMASKSGCPIVPVAISHTADVWEAHKPWVHATKVSLIYGKPIYFKELSPENQKHPGAYMKNIIEEMLS